jgi:hypothetical protein
MIAREDGGIVERSSRYATRCGVQVGPWTCHAPLSRCTGVDPDLRLFFGGGDIGWRRGVHGWSEAAEGRRQRDPEPPEVFTNGGS